MTEKISPIKILSLRREKAISESDKRTSELYKAIPETEKIDNEKKSLLRSLYSNAKKAGFEELVYAEAHRLDAERKELLKANGYPEDYDTPDFFCRKCCDTGYIKLEKCECLRELEDEYEIKYANTELGIGLKDCTFDNFDLNYYPNVNSNGKNPYKHMSEIFERCVSYANGFNYHSENLLFLGNTGLGKTHLSAAIGHTASGKGYYVVYDSVQKITADCRHVLFGASDENTEKYYTCDLLIMDDLGAEAINEFSISALTELVNRRLVSGKAMIISTNLTMDEINKKYGNRLFSRIVGNFTPYTFYGKDIRFLKL